MRQNRSQRKTSPTFSNLVMAEMLEYRRLLSAIPDPVATPTDGAVPLFQAGSNSPTGFSPTQIKTAYGIGSVSFNGVTGDGSGQTIAIIVAHDNPMFVDSTDPNFDTSDLHKFDQQFDLPDPPSFMKVDQNGGSDYPSTDPGWANEIALDVEWSHALAPSANILLVECASDNLSNLIEGGVEYATGVAGVSVVTMSFAVPEFLGETSYDSFLQSPSATHGVTFVAASGDDGSQGGYPAFSPNVLSVGATTLTLSGNNYGSESGRNTSGGGVSGYESRPNYQINETLSTVERMNPDVAFDGDQNTGVSVYDSFNGGASPWYKVGGTSFSSPAWAAMVAIADQGRATEGLGSLDGPSQTLPRLYSLSSSDFHDVTSGSNGYSAGPGYDLVTGLGTPIANKLIPDLAGGGSVKGTVFVDSNGNGRQDSGEVGLSGVTVFTDIDNNDQFEGADQEVTSSSNGSFDLTDLPGGTYHISATAPSGYRLTSAAGLTVTTNFGSAAVTGINFGYKATNSPDKLAFDEQPTTATAGAVVTPSITVKVEDSNGDVVPSDNSPVTLAVASGSATLTGSVTVDAVQGIATFSNLTFSTAGTDTLTATDGSLTAATSSSITVTGNTNTPAGSILVFAQQPTNTTIGASVTPPVTVDVETAAGSILTSDGSSVTLSVASGPGGLSGSETVQAVDGVATFSDVNLTAAGTYTLSASDGALAPITSTSFLVTAVPAQLAFSEQPSVANAGAVIVPAITVDVEDGGGNLVTTDNSPVTLSIAGGTGTLGGTITENAVNGVATFSDITVSAPGTYTLNASDGALTAATSNGFTINTPGTIAPVIVRTTLASSLVAGSKSRATVVVSETNIAANTSTGTLTTDVFATLNGQQTLLGSLVKKTTLKTKKSQTLSIPIKLIPADLTGTFTLQVVTTDTKGNLQTTGGETIKIAQPFISLSPTVTKLTLPASVLAGARTRAVAVVKITNTGNIPSTGITTARIYASPDGTVNSGQLINFITRPMNIKPGGFVLVTVPLTQIPATLDGTLQILAEVTDPNAVRTSVNTGTNLTVGAAFVTLTGTFGAPAPVTVAPGKSFSVTLTLTNNGNVPSTGSATLVLGLTADGTTAEPGSTTSVRPVSIPAGKSVALRLKIAVPASLAAGNYFPFATFTHPLASVTVAGTVAVTV